MNPVSALTHGQGMHSSGLDVPAGRGSPAKRPAEVAGSHTSGATVLGQRIGGALRQWTTSGTPRMRWGRPTSARCAFGSEARSALSTRT